MPLDGGLGWQKVKLGEVTRCFAGGTPLRSVPEYFGPGFPWLKSGEVRAGRIVRTEETITALALKESSARVAKSGTPVIAMYGATAGVAGILGIDAALNQAVLAVEPRDDVLDAEFCYRLLQSRAGRLLDLTQGSGQPNLSKGLIEGLEVSLPPLDEQRRIAEVLRSVDEAVASAVAVVREADRSLKLLAEQLLVAEAEATGSEVRLGDLLASIEAGVSVNSEGRLTEEGELGILKTSCVSAARFDPAEHKAVLEGERKRVRVPVTAESIILSRMNTLDLVGANAFVAENHLNLYLPDRLWLLKTNPNVRCRWLAYYMKTTRFRGQIVDIASGTSGSMKNISKGRFAELPIYVPGIELQDAAVEVLTSVEQAALRSADALESNKRVRESLSGDLLSGRVRVPA